MSRIAALAIVLGGLTCLIVGYALYQQVQHRARWPEIVALAASGPVAPRECLAPPPGAQLPVGFCHLDRDAKLNDEVAALVTEAADPIAREWLRHVLEHGWSGAVAQVTNATLKSGVTWSREAAALLDDEAAMLRVYARECVAREAAGTQSRNSLTRAYQKALEELAAPGGKYGRASKSFQLDSFLILLRKMRIRERGA